MADTMRALQFHLAASLGELSVRLAYAGGAVVAAIGIMSAVSIIGRSLFNSPITGDFELVEIGTAVAGSLFLPYCQATGGHIAVDFFTLKASKRTNDWLDRLGCLLMAAMFFAVGWRAVIGGLDVRQSGETSMLLGFPIWIGYAGMIPGVFVAGLVAFVQFFGVNVMGRYIHE